MAPLIALATQVGLPLIEKILTRKIGGANAALATDTVRQIAERVGTNPAGIDAVAAQEPGRVIDAMREVERMAPDLVAAYAAERDGLIAILQAEQAEPFWAWAWRPAGMWGLGALWLWNQIGLHVANAVWKIALPPTDTAVLMQISALYMTLYMGGHTVKDVAARWSSKG